MYHRSPSDSRKQIDAMGKSVLTDSRGERLIRHLQAERRLVAGSTWYLAFGVVMFLLARPVGRLLGRGLE
jgi:hypothetical protein